MGGSDQSGEIPAVDLESQRVFLDHLAFDTAHRSLFIAENHVVAILFHALILS